MPAGIPGEVAAQCGRSLNEVVRDGRAAGQGVEVAGSRLPWRCMSIGVACQRAPRTGGSQQNSGAGRPEIFADDLPGGTGSAAIPRRGALSYLVLAV